MIKRLTLAIILGLVTTALSFVVVTGKNVPMDPGFSFTTITGEVINALPCGEPHDTQPVTRGLPMNYVFYNVCHGTQIQLIPFVIDFLFWICIYLLVFFAYGAYSKRQQ